MEAELGAPAPQFGDHRHDRSDADAAGEKEMALGLLGEREMVARQRHLDDVADPHRVMQMARALAELLAQHGDAIAPPLGRVVPQGIVAPHPRSPSRTPICAPAVKRGRSRPFGSTSS